MKIAVWDTYVKREDGQLMHFDILVPDNLNDVNSILSFGKKYLSTKSFPTNELSTKECLFCHVEQATDEIIASIESNGYAIIEMENCH